MNFPAYKKVRVADLIPYARNARTHSEEQVAQIAASIREFGFLNPVIIDGDKGLIAGHGRVLAARKLGLETLPAIAAGHLTDAQRRAYILADNKIALNAGWDKDLLRVELDELGDMKFDLSLTGFSLDEIGDLWLEGDGEDGEEAEAAALSENYSRKIKAPTYEPRGEKPAVTALVDDTKAKSLVEDIRASDLPDDVKTFLETAAQRHTIFDFAKVADFYAHSDAPTQRLMEASGLVIVDFDDAIAHGFVTLTERLSQLAGTTADDED